MTCRYSPQYSLLLPTARAAGTRKVDNADSLAGIGNGHRAPDSIQLESRGKYEGMVEIDEGRQICAYNEQYWNSELSAARERAFGPALARVAEVVLYCQIPIKRFIDIGTGYLLDSLSWVLSSSRALFHGVELFPPELTLRTRHENYIVGSLASYSRPFQCDSCIEVAEHLTPSCGGHAPTAKRSE